MYKKLPFKFINFYIILCLIFTYFNLEISNNSSILISKADTELIYDKDDFFEGVFNNVVITHSNELELIQLNKSLREDFSNDSNIDSIKNLYIDKLNHELRLSISGNNFSKTYGGKNEDSGYGIEMTEDNGYILIGSTVMSSKKSSDIWIIKIDKFGNEQWNKKFGGSYSDIGESVIQTNDGGFILIGSTMGGSKTLLIKTDNYGNEEWNLTFNGTFMESRKKILQIDDDGYILVGTRYRSPGGEGHRIKPFMNGGNEDVWVTKISNKGDILWEKIYGTKGIEYGNYIQQTPNNDFIVVGFAEIDDDNGSDIWLICIDENGNEKWNRTFGGKSDEFGNMVLNAEDNGFIIIGSTNSYGKGQQDVWLVKIDKDGNEQWNRTFGGQHEEWGMSIQKTKQNSYIIIGSTGSYNFDDFDIWLLETDLLGNRKWSKHFGGKEKDFGNSIVQSIDGSYWLLGSTESFGNGSSDLYLIKTNCTDNSTSYGEMVSTNLLKNQHVSSIDSIIINADIPSETEIKIQFSKNKKDWFDSNNNLNNWNILKHGVNNINISSKSWQGNKFFCLVNFSSKNINSPGISDIELFIHHYHTIGEYESKFIYFPNVSNISLEWIGLETLESDIKLQIRTSKEISMLKKNKFNGYDGTTNTYFDSKNIKLDKIYNNSLWFQFKVFLFTNDTSVSPTFLKLKIIYNEIPKLNSPLLTPPYGTNSTIFNFTVTYIDREGNLPNFVKLSIDEKNYNMTVINPDDNVSSKGHKYYKCLKLENGNHSYFFIASDSYNNYSTEKQTLFVENVPLKFIEIYPNFIVIKKNENHIFIAKGFDAQSKIIPISPIWEVNGGGKIDKEGNFTSLKVGEWKVYANFSGISNYSVVIIVNDSNILDKDNDFLPDQWEQKYGFNSTNNFDKNFDFDNDDLINYEEYLNSTNPLISDTDNDGLLDGEEIKVYFTDPLINDTDGDNYLDGFEINKNSDPLDENDYPIEENDDFESDFRNNNQLFFVGLIITITSFLLILFLLKNKYFIKKV